MSEKKNEDKYALILSERRQRTEDLVVSKQLRKRLYLHSFKSPPSRFVIFIVYTHTGRTRVELRILNGMIKLS